MAPSGRPATGPTAIAPMALIPARMRHKLTGIEPPTEFKRRMEDRLQRWYHGKNPHPNPALQYRRLSVARLVNKSAMFAYAQQMTLPLPERYAEANDPDGLDIPALPQRVVIKPDNLSSTKGVLLFDGETEVLSGDSVPMSERGAYVNRRMEPLLAAKPGTRLIAEEFLKDVDPGKAIPRDFKTFVAGGRTHLIKVVDRNGKAGTTMERYYRRNWKPCRDLQYTNSLAPPIPKPERYDELLDLSDRIARDIQCFMRLDFYITQRGVVFGEFTSYPNAGNKHTARGSRVFCELMDRYPDPF